MIDLNISLSDNFKLYEFTKSATASQLGFENNPSPDVIANLRLLCQKVLQPLRTAYGKPIIITSGYRCKRLNNAVKGVINSQHLFGEAADFVTSPLSDLYKVYDIAKNLPDVDQCILEHKRSISWIHISYHFQPRRQFFIKKS